MKQMQKTILWEYGKKLMPAVLIIAATIIVSAVAYGEILADEEERCYMALRDSVIDTAEEANDRFGKNIAVLETAAFALSDERYQGEKEAVLSYVQQFERLTFFDRIDVITPDNASFRSLAEKGAHMSTPAEDPVSGEKAVCYYVPVVSEGDTAFLLSGVLLRKTLSELFAIPHYEDQVISCLIDPVTGDFVVSGEMAEDGEPVPKDSAKGRQLIESAQKTESGVIEWKPAGKGDSIYAYYFPSGLFQWKLAVIFQESIVFADLQAMKAILKMVSYVEVLLLAAYFLWNLHIVNQLTKSRNEVRQQLQTSTALVECVRELSSCENIDTAIENLLGIINRYFQGERCSIFSIDQEKQSFSKQYEYVEEGISRQMEQIQNIPTAVIGEWMERFQQEGFFHMKDVEKEFARESDAYQLLKKQNITAVAAIPFWEEERITGFVGVDNPRANYEDLSLLSSIRYFIIDSLERKRSQNILEYLSFQDTLTGVYNRNKFNQVIEGLQGQKLRRTGIAYFDLNGLKKVNDDKGHEAGDALLKGASEIIRRIFPDETYRIGGDEFVILAFDIDREQFLARTAEVQKLTEEAGISISRGEAWCREGIDIQRALREADDKMYVYKANYYRQGSHDRRRRNAPPSEG